MSIFGLKILTAKRYEADMATAIEAGEAAGRIAARLDREVLADVGRAVGQAERYAPQRRWPANRPRHLRPVP